MNRFAQITTGETYIAPTMMLERLMTIPVGKCHCRETTLSGEQLKSTGKERLEQSQIEKQIEDIKQEQNLIMQMKTLSEQFLIKVDAMRAQREDIESKIKSTSLRSSQTTVSSISSALGTDSLARKVSQLRNFVSQLKNENKGLQLQIQQYAQIFKIQQQNFSGSLSPRQTRQVQSGSAIDAYLMRVSLKNDEALRQIKAKGSYNQQRSKYLSGKDGRQAIQGVSCGY